LIIGKAILDVMFNVNVPTKYSLNVGLSAADVANKDKIESTEQVLVITNFPKPGNKIGLVPM